MGHNKNKHEYHGSILEVRAVEDCIRATKKYTEGIGTLRRKHPIQGEEFPSKLFVKYYEVYPDVEVEWNMPAGVALDWLWGETSCIDMTYKYDYRVNKASVIIPDGASAIKELNIAIPNFREAFKKLKTV